MRFRRTAATIMLTAGAFGLPTLAAPPAHAAVSCRDTDPRIYDLATGDPDGDGARGGITTGAVYVDRTGNGIYHVCVEGTLYDTDADTWGAAAWVEYEQWNGSTWVPEQHRLKRTNEGYGDVEPYGDDTYMTRNYYVQVCLIKSGYGGRNYCSGRG
jgi:hypothetical protein